MKKWLMAVLFISALVLAACGGATDDNAGDETGDDVTEEQPANDDAGTEDGADDGATEEDAGDSAAGGSVDVAAAEEVYKTNCSSCHGADLSGGMGPELNQAGANYSADEIADIIQNGKGQMPAIGAVEGEDLENISNWLASMK